MKTYIKYLLLTLVAIPIIFLLILSVYVYFGPVFNQPAGNSVKIEYVHMPVDHAWISVKEYGGEAYGVPQFGKHMGQRQYDVVDTYGEEGSIIKPKDSDLNVVIKLHTDTEPGKTYAVIYYTDKENDSFHFNETMLFYDTFVAK